MILRDVCRSATASNRRGNAMAVESFDVGSACRRLQDQGRASAPRWNVGFCTGRFRRRRRGVVCALLVSLLGAIPGSEAFAQQRLYGLTSNWNSVFYFNNLSGGGTNVIAVGSDGRIS